MALPRIDKPLFDLKVPSLDTAIKARPFVVKEEKILLTAQQSGSEKDIILAIKQVLQNCIVEPTFDADTLTTFDLEYMFLKLRARSVSNIIEVSYRDNDDNKVYEFEIDLDTVEMLQDKPINNKIMINDEVGIVMKFPSVTVLEGVPEEISATDLVEYLVRSCIEQIFDADEVYLASDQTAEELSDFIDSLDIETFNKIREFFDSLPQLYHKLEYVNANGDERTIELTTLNDFFTWR
tara:strand:- start:611 stop:1321 length:711 start_codon:yes stop_codon:yes gene_type:complete